MKKLLCIPLLCLLVLPGNGSGQELSYSLEADSIIAVGMNQVHQLETDSALVTFAELTQIYPDNPIGYFYRAAVYDLVNQNYRVTTFAKEFEKEVDLAIKTGEKFLKKNKEDPLAYFYLGGSYGFRGLHHVKKRNWIKAFVDGLKGLNNLQKSLAKKEDFYDAYFGLGMYHYWRSAMTKKLMFLPMMSDQRQQGIDELKMVIEKGKYAVIESHFGLVTCYYNEAVYDSALAINSVLYEQFPFDPSVLYMRAKILEKQGDWQNLLTVSEDLYKLITTSEHRSIGYQIECHYLSASALHQLGNKVEAISRLEVALGLKSKRKKKEELEGPIDDFDDVFKQAKALHKKLTS